MEMIATHSPRIGGEPLSSEILSRNLSSSVYRNTEFPILSIGYQDDNDSFDDDFVTTTLPIFERVGTLSDLEEVWENGEILSKSLFPADTEVAFNYSYNQENGSMPELPIDMQFNEGHRLAIVIYSLLMIISAVGNISVLTAIIKLRIKGRLSRINLFLLHLAIADLLVTFLMMPLEIIWNATVSWRAGDVMCRVMSFFRIFGLYLSGFVLVCISMDRYFAVLKPLAIPDANSRGRIMLTAAWVASVICSLPQSLIFHVETHPVFIWYQQCVTFNSFPSPEYELAYNFFGFFFLYGLPLIMILFCYSRILYEIYRINALKKNEDQELRRSNMGALGRAKIRTLKMTVIIVATFCFCWTPYNIMCLWYWFDKSSAMKVDQRIQKGLFLFACTNSCVNPLIYGLFHIHARQKQNSTMIQRSLPNGYHRPPHQSEHYKMRVRWKPTECCIMGCGNSGSSDRTPVVSTSRRNNHVHVRPTQQFWVGNSDPRHANAMNISDNAPRRDITVENEPHHQHNTNRLPPHQHNHHNLLHNGHRRCSNFQMTEFQKRRGSLSCRYHETPQNPKSHIIDYKRNGTSSAQLSSVL